jgi:hypothetical protein
MSASHRHRHLGYVFIDASDGRGELSARPIEATADAPILLT